MPMQIWVELQKQVQVAQVVHLIYTSQPVLQIKSECILIVYHYANVTWLCIFIRNKRIHT